MPYFCIILSGAFLKFLISKLEQQLQNRHHMQIVGLFCLAPGHEGGRVSNHVDFWFSTDTILLFLTDVWSALKIQNKTLPCGIFSSDFSPSWLMSYTLPQVCSGVTCGGVQVSYGDLGQDL